MVPFLLPALPFKGSYPFATSSYTNFLLEVMDFSCGLHEFISKVCHNERVIAHTRARMMHVLDRTCLVGLESVPSTFVGLFLSHNFGKKIVRVSHD